MTEKELIELGFNRFDVSEKWGGKNPFYYYWIEFGNGSFSLISNSSDDLEDGEWVVELYDDESIRFTNSQDIKDLIRIINKNTL